MSREKKRKRERESASELYGVRKGSGSQSMVICVGKYPGGQSRKWVLWGPAKAVGYEWSD